MPNYPIPPWLHGPPDPGEEFTRSYAAGASVAESQARLQAQAIQFQQEHAMEQQRLEISKQYQQTMLGLKQQQLQQQGQLIQARTQQAARQFQIQQKFEQNRRAYQDQGLSELEATQRALREAGPGIGANAAAFYRDLTPRQPPQIMTTPQGHEYLYDQFGGTKVFPAGRASTEGKFTDQEKEELKRIDREEARIEKADIPTSPGDITRSKKAARTGESFMDAWGRMQQEKIADLERQRQAIYQQGKSPAPGPTAAPPDSSTAAPGAGPGKIDIIRDPSGKLIVAPKGGKPSASAAPAAAPGAPTNYANLALSAIPGGPAIPEFVRGVADITRRAFRSSAPTNIPESNPDLYWQPTGLGGLKGSFKPDYPDPPSDPGKRVYGKIYKTKDGPMQWQGEWVEAT